MDVHFLERKTGGLELPRTPVSATKAERRTRGCAAGFRVDAETKGLVERAAALERIGCRGF
jgi:hypothetical protein